MSGVLGRTGWDRSSAWICDFSSTQSSFREAQLVQQHVERLLHEGLLCAQQFLDPRLLRRGLDTSC
ncbi:hypothetical protein ACWGI1_12210 [Streptomyces sp. NPDC054835]